MPTLNVSDISYKILKLKILKFMNWKIVRP